MSTEANSFQPTTRPWQVWVVGTAALLWNAVGAYDYVMTKTKNAGYMAGFTPEQLAFFYGFPAWVVAAWAIAVWGGVLGSVLLLMRRRQAVPVFLASFVAAVVTSVHNFVLSDGMQVFGDAGSLVFSAIILVVALALWLYAKRLAARRVLA
jgi:hypothetical protein